MRAVRFHGRGDIRVDEIEEPVCGDGQVKVSLAFMFMRSQRYLQYSNNEP